MKQYRHAYMIMAHHKFDILERILVDIDDKRNDIFLHIDSKAKNLDADKLKKSIKYANLHLTSRMDVKWGGFSQIKCILMLLEAATSSGYHSYYHFMVGVEFPLQSQIKIHDFFDKNNGFEFIGFDNADQQYIERIRYYHPFNEYARNNTFFQKILNKVRICAVSFQALLDVDFTKNYSYAFKKGNANWSITHSLAMLIVSKKSEIYKIYRHSFCGDEVFIHTILYNSQYWDNVYDKNDEYHSSMRKTTWQNKKNQYTLENIGELFEDNRLFARKIDGDDAMEVIDYILNKR